jgi:hypothetical protein
MAESILVQPLYGHQGRHRRGTIPVLTVDRWEHTDALRYLNAKDRCSTRCGRW